MDSTENTRPKYRISWPLLWGGVALVVLLMVGGAIVGFSLLNGGENPPAAAPKATTSAPDSGTQKIELGTLAPSGCIAGNSTSIDALLTAQQEAKPTATGAADFTVALARYLMKVPDRPTAAEWPKFQSVLAPSSPLTFADTQKIPPVLTSLAAKGTPIVISTVNGAAHVAPDEKDPKRVVVTISEQFVVDGVLLSTYGATGAVTLEWDGQHWTFIRAQTPQFDYDELAKIGTPFMRGC